MTRVQTSFNDSGKMCTETWDMGLKTGCAFPSPLTLNIDQFAMLEGCR